MTENKGRIFMVANRLPITIEHDPAKAQYNFKLSSGGLVSGLKSLSKTIEFKWFGWPGIDVHHLDQAKVADQLEREFNAVPLFLPEDIANHHYNGFSNCVLWPLLHRMPEKALTDENWSNAYKRVNKMFAEAIEPQIHDGDIIWIHDYHLLLLPCYLREMLSQKANVRIGFFLHTPFPSEDYFSILPFREAICNGLLSCDLVGFHIRKYVEDFLDGAEKVLEGVDRSPSDLHYQGRKLVVHQFPIGIDPEEFLTKVKSEPVQQRISTLGNEFKGMKVLVGVDRLDYIKGIPQKLLAFDRFLSDNPDWIGKVVLIQLAIPTRSDIEEYKRLRRQVEELVGHINGKHGTFSYVPIKYLYRSIPPEELCALYAVSDACVISSIRDGLNMVSYEYVACQTEKKGVLVLSQYTGAAQTLPSSVIVNPWDAPRFAATIGKVLEMPAEERENRHEDTLKVVNHWTSLHWGQTFLKTLSTMQVQEVDPEQDIWEQMDGKEGEKPTRKELARGNAKYSISEQMVGR